MATDLDFITYVCDCIREAGDIRYRKMFGEAMIYVNDKPLLLVTNNTVHIKMYPELSELLATAPTAFPYEGAKLHYVLDVENSDLALEAIIIAEKLAKIPAKKKSKPNQAN